MDSSRRASHPEEDIEKKVLLLFGDSWLIPPVVEKDQSDSTCSL